MDLKYLNIFLDVQKNSKIKVEKAYFMSVFGPKCGKVTELGQNFSPHRIGRYGHQKICNMNFWP
jgi:hypothetical protein